jgi:hypothetical protein
MRVQEQMCCQSLYTGMRSNWQLQIQVPPHKVHQKLDALYMLQQSLSMWCH